MRLRWKLKPRKTGLMAKALVLKYGIDPLHLVLQVERHHGIKGGQHGTDT